MLLQRRIVSCHHVTVLCPFKTAKMIIHTICLTNAQYNNFGVPQLSRNMSRFTTTVTRLQHYEVLLQLL